MGKKLLIFVVVALMTVVAAQVAFAATTSHISIAYNHKTERFHGKVTSSNNECQAGRTVRLYKKTSSGRTLEGKTTSTKTGGWKIEVMHASGHYFAMTPRQTVMHTKCAGARSSTIDVM